MSHQIPFLIVFLAIFLFSSLGEAQKVEGTPHPENYCETKIHKKLLGSCTTDGNQAPAECITGTNSFTTQNDYDPECVAKGCVKECQGWGGDELIRNTGTVPYYLCCVSKTPGKEPQTKPSCDGCKLVPAAETSPTLEEVLKKL